MPAIAQKKYDPGATDTEIKVGNIMPYSGPLSAYALIGRTEARGVGATADSGPLGHDVADLDFGVRARTCLLLEMAGESPL